MADEPHIIKYVKTGTDLYQWFYSCGSKKQLLKQGIMVSTAIRKEVLTSTKQGKITLRGSVYSIQFENMNGGVYRAYIKVKS